MLIKRIANKIFKQPLRRFLISHYPKVVLSRLWLQEFGYPLNWKNPKDLNEKIQWLIANSDTSEWTRLADKVKVRDYVTEKGLKDMLVPLLGVWSDARNIDFDNLPNKFVLKCNHDSGSVIIIDKQKGFDKIAVINKLNSHLCIKFGYCSCEPHYNKIKPLILAEEFLKIDKVACSTSPIDYKFFCANGIPYAILVIYDRTKESIKIETYDLNWNLHSDQNRYNSHYISGGWENP